MAIKYEVKAVTGKYTGADGKEKNEYFKIGVVMETKNGGLMMKIQGTPLNWDGMAYLNTPYEAAKEQPQQQTLSTTQQDDDSIPF